MQCTICDDHPEMEDKQTTHSVKVGTTTVTGEVQGLVCPQCNRSYVVSDESLKFRLRAAVVLSQYTPTPESITFMREALGYTGKDLAKLLDISHEHMSRMEHGKRLLDRGLVALMGLMVNDANEGRDTTVKILKNLMAAKVRPEPVKL